MLVKYSPVILFLSFISHFKATIFLVQKPEILHEDETSAGDGSPQKSIIFLLFVSILQLSFAAILCYSLLFSSRSS